MACSYIFHTAPFRTLTPAEFAQVGTGSMAYLKVLTPEEAQRLFPNVEGLPPGVLIYLVAAADGRPLALADTLCAAVGHIIRGKLQEVTVH